MATGDTIPCPRRTVAGSAPAGPCRGALLGRGKAWDMDTARRGGSSQHQLGDELREHIQTQKATGRGATYRTRPAQPQLEANVDPWLSRAGSDCWWGQSLRGVKERAGKPPQCTRASASSPLTAQVLVGSLGGEGGGAGWGPADVGNVAASPGGRCAPPGPGGLARSAEVHSSDAGGTARRHCLGGLGGPASSATRGCPGVRLRGQARRPVQAADSLMKIKMSEGRRCTKSHFY